MYGDIEFQEHYHEIKNDNFSIPQWISINKQLPPDYKEFIFLYMNNHSGCIGLTTGYRDGNNWYHSCFNSLNKTIIIPLIHPVKYWIPFPDSYGLVFE